MGEKLSGLYNVVVFHDLGDNALENDRSCARQELPANLMSAFSIDDVPGGKLGDLQDSIKRDAKETAPFEVTIEDSEVTDYKLSELATLHNNIRQTAWVYEVETNSSTPRMTADKKTELPSVISIDNISIATRMAERTLWTVRRFPFSGPR